MRLSVRHLGGLIYDAVDDFVRGPIRDQRAQPLLPKQMRSKAEAPSPDRSGSIFSPGPKAFSHSRRSLSPAEFGKCRIDDFISRSWEVELSHRWWLGRACRSSSARLRASVEIEWLLEPSNRCTADRRCGTSLVDADPHRSTGFSFKITSES